MFLFFCFSFFKKERINFGKAVLSSSTTLVEVEARSAAGKLVRIEGLTSRLKCNGIEGIVKKLLPGEQLLVVVSLPMTAFTLPFIVVFLPTLL